MADRVFNLREFQRVQRSLAYRAAVEIIDCSSTCIDYLVYDLRSVLGTALERVTDALRWLETYGLVTRDPENPALITIAEEQLLDQGHARPAEWDAIELSDKVLLKDSTGAAILEVDGVKMSLDLLIAMANPDPAQLYRLERKGDEVILHTHRFLGGAA